MAIKVPVSVALMEQFYGKLYEVSVSHQATLKGISGVHFVIFSYTAQNEEDQMSAFIIWAVMLDSPSFLSCAVLLLVQDSTSSSQFCVLAHASPEA